MSAFLLSRSVAYAIRAMAYLASQPPGRRTGGREISDREQIPRPFLWKILQLLRRSRLLTASPGAGGGYTLAVPASQIRLLEIVEAIEGPPERLCMLGKARCPADQLCPLHHRLEPVREQFFRVLRNTTLQDVVTKPPGESASEKESKWLIELDGRGDLKVCKTDT